jgi:hypothetical protein
MAAVPTRGRGTFRALAHPKFLSARSTALVDALLEAGQHPSETAAIVTQ